MRVVSWVAVIAAACGSEEKDCASRGKDVYQWCTIEQVCSDPGVGCPSRASEDTCDMFNGVMVWTSDGQRWVWDEATQACVDENA